MARRWKCPGARYRGRVVKPLQLPFDPIARAAAIWERRFGPAASMAAVASIMRAQQILLAELDAVLRPYGLTFARYEALVLLSFSRRGVLPLGVLGERLMVHPTSVTNIIDRLENQGLVARRRNPLDGRGRLAEITRPGRDAVERATADLMAAGFCMSGYDPRRLREIFAVLRGLRVSAGDFVLTDLGSPEDEEPGDPGAGDPGAGDPGAGNPGAGEGSACGWIEPEGPHTIWRR
jgi:DNA-binding MarR family transcriptional regulator